MSLCPASECCPRNTDEIDMQVKDSTGVPGLQSGDKGLPEPPPRAKVPETAAAVPRPPVKDDELPELKMRAAKSMRSQIFHRGNTLQGASEVEVGASLVFVVEIEKTPTTMKVGLDVDHGDERTLAVMLVKNGLVQVYNEGASENRKIKVGDRIIEVNGCTGDIRKMLETIGHEAKLRFVVEPCRRG